MMICVSEKRKKEMIVYEFGDKSFWVSLCAKRCVKHFTCSISFHLYSKPYGRRESYRPRFTEEIKAQVS